ncbi:MAG: TatD family hydrolase [Nanoarchaeota archaeon]
MLLVDVHAHLDFPDYKDDLPLLLADWYSKGLRSVIVNGVHPESNRQVLSLSQKYPLIKSALGYYPTHVIEVSEEAFDTEIAWIEKQNPIALGEVGLDYKNSDENPFGDEKAKEMKAGFAKIIALAEKKKIPLIVHSRKAEEDVVDMLESSHAKKVVMHCFMGKKTLLKRIIDNGWSTSIPCLITRSHQFQDMARMQDLSKILTETDAPYLSPYSDIKRNEPPFVIETIKKIAEIKRMDAEEVANNVWKNYQEMFL